MGLILLFSDIFFLRGAAISQMGGGEDMEKNDGTLRKIRRQP